MRARTHDDRFTHGHAIENFHKLIVCVANFQLATLWSFRRDDIRKVLSSERNHGLNWNLEHILLAIFDDDSNLSCHAGLKFSDPSRLVENFDHRFVLFQVRIRPAARNRH